MADKLNMETKNLAKENYKKLIELFPNIVTETTDEDGNVVRAIDADLLQQEINEKVVEGAKERYVFTWPDKKRFIALGNEATTNTLRLDKEKSVGRDGTPGSIDTGNIYIEGDNLEALKLLRETYLGKVQMIYIDPPYNTGNDSFVYDDDSSISEEEFEERSGARDEEGNLKYDFKVNNESNGRFHTDWLNMMYPRLALAKDLLSDDGVIFISIDDNEQENLKKICNEIFGAKNFYGEFIQLKGNTQNDAKSIQKNHEYILCYVKQQNDLLLTYQSDVYKKVYDSSYYLGRDTGASSGHDKLIERPKLGYTIYYKEDQNGDDSLMGHVADEMNRRYGKFKYFTEGNCFKHAVAVCDYDADRIKENSAEDEIYNNCEDLIEKGYIKIRPPKRKGGKLGCWTWSIETFQGYWNNGEVAIVNNRNVYKKEIITDSNKIVRRGGNEYVVSSNIIPLKSVIEITNSKGSLELKGNDGLIPGCEFNNPKSVDLLKYLIGSYNASRDDLLVLDFFSGSATTAHAVMQLNAEDCGHRKFILVQLAEPCADPAFKNICEIGEERIRRAGRKIKEESPLTTGDLDIGFRVYRVDDSNMKDVYYKPNEITQDMLETLAGNIKENRTGEDLLIQIMLELGIDLSSKIEETEISGKKVFSVSDGYMMACFEDKMGEDVVTQIAKKEPYYAVFRDGGFANDSLMTNYEQIFNVYSPKTIVKVL